MTPKPKADRPKRVVVTGKSPDLFHVVWRDPDGEGRLIPASRSKLVTREGLDVTEALKAWLEVWSCYELFNRSRTARRFVEEARRVGPETAAKVLGVDSARLAQLAQDAKHCAQRRDVFDERVRGAANTYGSLGVGGTEIREIIWALTELQRMILMFDPEVDRTLLREIPAKEQPMRRWADAVGSSRFEAGTWTCPDLYAALVMRVTAMGGLRYGTCEVCTVQFIRQRSDAKTCGERCRSLLRSQKRRHKRA